MESDIPTYLGSWGRELTARANRVRQLLGDTHWASDGYHKEAILREFLVRHISLPLSVSRGFIRDVTKTNFISPEIDIQIADHSIHPPLLNESDLCITVPSALVAHVEVKTQLTKPTLRNALDTCQKTRSVALAPGAGYSPYGLMVFYERRSKTRDSDLFRLVCQVICDAFHEGATATGREEVAPMRQLLVPNTIVCLNRFVVFVKNGTTQNEVRLLYYGAGDKSGSYGFADLFSDIRSRYVPSNIINEMDLLLESMPVDVQLAETIDLA